MHVEKAQDTITFLDFVRKVHEEKHGPHYVEKRRRFLGRGKKGEIGRFVTIRGRKIFIPRKAIRREALGEWKKKQEGGDVKKETALPKGTKIRWNAGLKANARAMPDNSVHIGPKFFSEVPQEERGLILAHEFGHVLEQVTGAIRSGTTFDRAMSILEDKKHSKPRFWWGYGDGYNVNEAWANAFRDYAMSRSRMKRQHPKVYAYIHSFARKYPEFAKTDYKAIAAQLESGPEGGRLTIFDKTQE